MLTIGNSLLKYRDPQVAHHRFKSYVDRVTIRTISWKEQRKKTISAVNNLNR